MGTKTTSRSTRLATNEGSHQPVRALSLCLDVRCGSRDLLSHATTDANGRYAFSALLLGSYDVTATLGGADGEVRVDFGSGGASAPLALQKIGSVAVVRSTSTRGSGSDVVPDHETLTRSSYSDSFPEALVQLPGAVRGADGVVHLNGDHDVVDYLVDPPNFRSLHNRASDTNQFAQFTIPLSCLPDSERRQ